MNSKNGKTFKTINPATEEVITEVQEADAVGSNPHLKMNFLVLKEVTSSMSIVIQSVLRCLICGVIAATFNSSSFLF